LGLFEGRWKRGITRADSLKRNEHGEQTMSLRSFMKIGLVGLLSATNACGGDAADPEHFNAATLSFAPPIDIDLADLARSATVADFNGDGVSDIAVACSSGSQGSVRVILGQRNGTFQTPKSYSTENGSEMIAAADWNGDQKPDLVVSNYDDDSLSILLNQGDGSFQPAVRIAVDPKPFRLAVGDVNGDHRTDIVVPSDSTNLAVMLSNGDGTFRRVDAALTVPSITVALGDLTGDGKLDIVATGELDKDLHVLRGLGDGSFQKSAGGTGADFARFIGLADVDNDGRLDVAVALDDLSSGHVSLWRGVQGGLGAPSTIATTADPEGLAFANMNGDGAVDLVVVANQNDAIEISLGDGAGHFTSALSLPTPAEPSVLAVGDLNGDGKPDLVVPTLRGQTLRIFLNTSH
jgi:hypothetical protein